MTEESVSHARSLATFGAQFAGASNAGYQGYDRAWSIPSAWRASTLLGGLIGSLPVDAYKNVVGAPPRLLSPAPVILANPVPRRSNVEVRSAWVHDFLFHGNAVGIIASRDPMTGWPTSVIPVPATWVTVMAPYGQTNMDIAVLAGNVIYRIQGQDFTPQEIFHVRGPCAPGALRGVGVLEAALSSFELAIEQREQASSVGTHGVPTGLLYADDTDVTPDEMVSGRSDFMRSQQDGRTIAALPPGVKFQALSWNPEELQLIEARKMSDADMALLFGLPASFLNVERNSRTYANIGQEDVQLLKYSADQIITRFDEEWTRHLPRGTVAKTDVDRILETDLASWVTTAAAAITAGIWDVNEAREMKGLQPLTPEQRAAMKPAASPQYGSKYGEPKSDPAPAEPTAPEAPEADAA